MNDQYGSEIDASAKGQDSDIGRISRRGFVAASTAVVAGAAVFPGSAASAFAAAVPSPLSRMGLSRFRAARGQRFSVSGKGLRATLELVSVTNNPKLTAPGGECFTIRFRSLSGSKLEQGSYRFSSPTLGAFSLFVVPGGARSKSYTAVINRLG